MSDDYDFFVSYARADNQQGFVRNFVDGIVEQHAQFSGGRRLQYFFDTERIPNLSAWETEIFQKGLTRSRLFLAFLSPAYFASDICRREWKAWLDREIALHIFSEGSAPVYFVEVPGLYSKPMQTEADVARAVAELCGRELDSRFTADVSPVVREMRRRQLVSRIVENQIQPFCFEGMTELRRHDLADTLRRLAADIDERSIQVQRAAASDNEVPPYNPQFTGRRDELIELRRKLTDRQTGVIAGIHGLGGIGKTELAYTYAHAFAGVYPGGRYAIGCEFQPNLSQAVLQLDKFAAFHSLISDEERKDPQAHFAAIARVLKQRIENLGHVLLVLDNVASDTFLDEDQTDPLTRLGGKLHLLATTRLEPETHVGWLMLGELTPEDARALLDRYRPAETPEDHAAAEAIVEKLGGFALAIELVAAHLQVNPRQSYVGMLELLDLDDLDRIAEQKNVKLRRHNHEKRLAKILGPTWVQLTASQQRMLQYASLLPPDHVSLKWVHQLVSSEFAELDQVDRLTNSTRWESELDQLIRLGIFTRVEQKRSNQTTVRIHRLLQSFVIQLDSDGLAEQNRQLLEFVDELAVALQRSTLSPAELPEIESLAAFVEMRIGRDDFANGRIALVTSSLLLRRGDLAAARRLALRAHTLLERRSQASPENADYQRDLSVSCNKLGDLFRSLGDGTQARHYHEQALGIRQRLAEAAPENADYQRDLSVSYNNLGDLFRSLGEGTQARHYYEQDLAIAERLAEASPENADYQRDLSVSYNKLGDLFRSLGDGSQARHYYELALEIAQRLAEASPENADYQRDLSVSYNTLGDLFRSLGEGTQARHYYEQALAIAERLAEASPENADYQRDLSVSYNKLGDLFRSLGDGTQARHYYEQALGIRQRLAEASPENADYQRDLGVSLDKLFVFHAEREEVGVAIAHLLEFLRAWIPLERRGALSDPADLQYLQSRKDIAARVGLDLSEFDVAGDN